MQSIFIGFTHPSYFNGCSIEFHEVDREAALEAFKDATIYSLVPHVHRRVAEILGLEGQILRGNVQPREGDRILFISPLEKVEHGQNEIPELMVSLGIVRNHV